MSRKVALDYDPADLVFEHADEDDHEQQQHSHQEDSTFFTPVASNTSEETDRAPATSFEDFLSPAAPLSASRRSSKKAKRKRKRAKKPNKRAQRAARAEAVQQQQQQEEEEEEVVALPTPAAPLVIRGDRLVLVCDHGIPADMLSARDTWLLILSFLHDPREVQLVCRYFHRLVCTQVWKGAARQWTHPPANLRARVAGHADPTLYRTQVALGKQHYKWIKGGGGGTFTVLWRRGITARQVRHGSGGLVAPLVTAVHLDSGTFGTSDPIRPVASDLATRNPLRLREWPQFRPPRALADVNNYSAGRALFLFDVAQPPHQYENIEPYWEHPLLPGDKYVVDFEANRVAVLQDSGQVLVLRPPESPSAYRIRKIQANRDISAPSRVLQRQSSGESFLSESFEDAVTPAAPNASTGAARGVEPEAEHCVLQFCVEGLASNASPVWVSLQDDFVYTAYSCGSVFRASMSEQRVEAVMVRDQPVLSASGEPIPLSSVPSIAASGDVHQLPRTQLIDAGQSVTIPAWAPESLDFALASGWVLRITGAVLSAANTASPGPLVVVRPVARHAITWATVYGEHLIMLLANHSVHACHLPTLELAEIRSPDGWQYSAPASLVAELGLLLVAGFPTRSSTTAAVRVLDLDRILAQVPASDHQMTGTVKLPKKITAVEQIHANRWGGFVLANDSTFWWTWVRAKNMDARTFCYEAVLWGPAGAIDAQSTLLLSAHRQSREVVSLHISSMLHRATGLSMRDTRLRLQYHRPKQGTKEGEASKQDELRKQAEIEARREAKKQQRRERASARENAKAKRKGGRSRRS